MHNLIQALILEKGNFDSEKFFLGNFIKLNKELISFYFSFYVMALNKKIRICIVLSPFNCNITLSIEKLSWISY